MDYIQKTIWATPESVKSHDIDVVVAEITEKSVTISEETSTSSQQVWCNREKLMEALKVHTEEELMAELQNRVGNACGYDNAKQFMEDNGIEFNWYGGSN